MLTIFLQAATPPPLLPWWVLYAVLLAISYGTYRMAKSRWWKGCLTAAAGWALIFITASITLPLDRPWLILLVTFAPVVAYVAALLSAGRAGPAPGFAAATARRFALSGETMKGQPTPRSVMKSKLMGARFAAGLPHDAGYVARLDFVSGLEGVEQRPVDLFLGGGSLWVAPLKPGSAPIPIALRDVLRVDVWPEADAPPTLRVSWSPPAGDLTRELVLGALPEVPPPLVGRQLGAFAGALTGAMVLAEESVLSAGNTPSPVAVVPADICPRCGTAFAEGARRCAMCGLERPHG